MCQNKDTLSCEGGNVDTITEDINSVTTCNCKPGYYGDRCQFSAHCQDGMTMTSKGCIVNCDIDVSYQYLRIFFEPDDKKLKQIHDDYKSGKMLTGELKQILIEKINKFLASHQQKREKARDQLDKFLLKD